MIRATGSAVLNRDNSLKFKNLPKKRAAKKMLEQKPSSSATHDMGSAEEEDGPKVDPSSPIKKAAQETEDIELPSSQSHVEGSTEGQDAMEADDEKLCKIAAEAMAELKLSSEGHNVGSGENQVDLDVKPRILMPVGTELTTVCGIEIQPKDLGKALQFLEFCNAFGEASDVLIWNSIILFAVLRICYLLFHSFLNIFKYEKISIALIFLDHLLNRFSK